MAITFLEERKIQKRFILILGIILLIIVLVIWQGFFVKEKPLWETGKWSPGEIVEPAKKVEIDFEILESPILKGLEPFEEIKTYEEEISEGVVTEKIGRENPFLPY